MAEPITNWDDAYANGAYIPGSAALPAQWLADAETYRKTVAVTEHSYGDDPREVFDLVMPDGPPKGLVVFVHGGYWVAFDKSSWSAFAEGARANGWAVCIPSYTLAPYATIAKITQQVGAAVTMAAAVVDGPIRLVGHSAGGHLVTRMICEDTPLSDAILDRVAHVMPISGVHDLRPLLRTTLNEKLLLDETEAAGQSPALRMPKGRARLTAWVGGGERPEFLRQSQLISNIWTGLGVDTTCVVDGDLNHFNVIDGLREPASPITRALLGDE